MKSLNEFDPCSKFTYDSNKESIVFRDIKVSFGNGKVFTDVYVKPTDSRQYLHYLCAHPYHTKKSVVFSQTLWISKSCSSEKDYENHKEEMKHPEDLISSEMRKVKFSNLRLKRNVKNHNMNGTPLLVKYYPCLSFLVLLLIRT